MEFAHKSVFLEEAVNYLNVKDNGIYVDGTLGGAGHSSEILKKNRTCFLLGIDRDESAIKASEKKLKDFDNRIKLIRGNFKDAGILARENGITEIDGFLLDLGVSSHQFDEGERGFSYRTDAELDMRMDLRQELNAYKIVNEYSEKALNDIIFKLSDERWAARISKFIVEERKKNKIKTTFELVDIIKKAIPHGARRDGGHPAKRTFQALRMEVNNELDNITKAIDGIIPILKREGRIVVITFHSIEDRLVKEIFKKLSDSCNCPHDFPVCVCGKKNILKIITRKPLKPGENEMIENPRSESAKMRVAEKI